MHAMKQICSKTGLRALLLCIAVSAPSRLSYAQEKEKEPVPGDSKEIIKMDTEGEDEESLLEKKGPRFKFKGQVKNLYLFHRSDNYVAQNPLITSSKNLSSDLTRVRLSPEFLYRDIVTVKVDYDNELILSNYGKSAYFKSYWRPNQYNDLLHLAWEPYRGDIAYWRTKIHRAYAKVSVDYFTATVGRQQIRFGSGKLWNPLDILNPISPTFVEGGDEQKGTDAVRLDFFPDEKTEITLVYDMKKSNNDIRHFNMQDCNYIVRAKTSIKDTDIAILGGYVSRRGVAGFDFAAILFKGMLRGSMIVSPAGEKYAPAGDPWRLLRFLIPGKDGDESVFFEANAGYEYTFKNGVYFLVEYFYNQKGINYNKSLKMAFMAAQFNAMNQKTYLHLANQFPTLNQHYGGLALGYDFHPLVRGELFCIGDIQGRAIFWAPALKVNALENLDLTVGILGAFSINNKASDFVEFRKNYLFYASGSYVF
ncbi:MAG: hypothetical protein A2W19_05745 [Spirochaetes bacterium RBG_16_49_21]|nr:MAG: hypothetical protein A2W19_05745 [Spirochaetes bacterium RBG_16_49_21]